MVARTDYNLSAEKIFRLHESFNTRLPREGAAERLRELPFNTHYPTSSLAQATVPQRTEGGFPSAEKIFRLHESRGTWLPREGAAEG